MIHIFIKYSYFFGAIFLISLGLKLLFEIISRKKSKYLKTLRLLINYSIILNFCSLGFSSLAIIVRPMSPITNSLNESLDNLSKWIIDKELIIVFWGLAIISILGFLNRLYLQKIENVKSVRPIIVITSWNFLILVTSLILIYIHTYEGMAYEIWLQFD